MIPQVFIITPEFNKKLTKLSFDESERSNEKTCKQSQVDTTYFVGKKYFDDDG